MNGQKQIQVSQTTLWSHVLGDGEIKPPPPPTNMPGKWHPVNLVPSGSHIVILWGWAEEPSMVAVPQLQTGGFVGAGR